MSFLVVLKTFCEFIKACPKKPSLILNDAVKISMKKCLLYGFVRSSIDSGIESKHGSKNKANFP